MSRPALSHASAFVLAGGQSTRMGLDKATLRADGRPLIAHMLGKLEALGFAPEIAGSRPDLLPFAPVLGDLHPGCGPLAGIEAALASTATPLNLFVAVDLPLLPPQLLQLLLERAACTGALATMPSVGGQPQPLCAVYHRDFLPAVHASLEAGSYKVMRAVRGATHPDTSTQDGKGLDLFRLEAVRSAAGIPWLPVCLADAFLNCNTPEEHRLVEEQLARGREATWA